MNTMEATMERKMAHTMRQLTEVELMAIDGGTNWRDIALGVGVGLAIGGFVVATGGVGALEFITLAGTTTVTGGSAGLALQGAGALLAMGGLFL